MKVWLAPAIEMAHAHRYTSIQRSRVLRITEEHHREWLAACTASSAVGSAPALAAAAWCDDSSIYLGTVDGRVVKRGLPEFLRKLTPAQRRNCRVDESGTAIYWPDVDEELGVDWVFGVAEDVIEDLAGFEKGPFPEDAV